MAKCTFCGKTETLPFTCKFCGGKFCGEHRLPENHECDGLRRFKEQRTKAVEEWIYDPFKKEHKRKAGRTVEPSLPQRIMGSFSTIDSRKVLYAIVVIIIILTLFMSMRG